MFRKLNKIALLFLIMTLSMSSSGQNLVVNGDFEGGNANFQTEYIYSNAHYNTFLPITKANPYNYSNPNGDMGDPGFYTVGVNPLNYHGSWTPPFGFWRSYYRKG